MNASLALVADIGGTNARFALADVSLPAPLLSDTIRQLLVTDFPSLVHAAQHYLGAIGNLAGQPGTGVFAVAGRVDGDEARITNHPWLISRRATAEALGFQHFHLVNDFTAQAMAVQLLTDDDLAVIGDIARCQSTAPSRTYAVIGPGTGLGVSGLLVRDGIATALETEGGHVSFAPSNPEELEILRELSQDFGRVSDERLLSGGGLVNIHRALSRLAGTAVPTALRPQDITERARQGDAGCARAVEVFCAVFGAIAGDLVLTLGAWDGVFLSGGLVPKLLDSLQRSQFRQRFKAKGRFSSALEKVPTIAVTHPHAGLLGAAAMAVHGDVR